MRLLNKVLAQCYVTDVVLRSEDSRILTLNDFWPEITGFDVSWQGGRVGMTMLMTLIKYKKFAGDLQEINNLQP